MQLTMLRLKWLLLLFLLFINVACDIISFFIGLFLSLVLMSDDTPDGNQRMTPTAVMVMMIMHHVNRRFPRTISVVPDRGWYSHFFLGNFFRTIFGHRRPRSMEDLPHLQRFVSLALMILSSLFILPVPFFSLLSSWLPIIMLCAICYFLRVNWWSIL